MGQKIIELPMAASWKDGSWLYDSYRSLIKIALKSFDDNVEKFLLSFLIYFQITGKHIYNGYPKLKSPFVFWSNTQTMF